MTRASLAQWLQRLETLHPREMDLGLERVAIVAHALQLLPLVEPVVTVAGTNGKGSTVAVLEALLAEAGYSSGVFTSPHLLRFNERIRVAGTQVTDTEITDSFRAIDDARGAISLTYFEFATLAALLVFKSRAPDVVVLEVGLGGRLDAVNIVDPTVAVITSIDLDHQHWLGDSRGAIAREKAGILRSGRAVVIADPDPPPELIRCVSDVSASPALYLGREFTVATARDRWWANLREADGRARVITPQPCGSLLPENVCAAAQAALLLGVVFSDDNLSRAMVMGAPLGRRQLRQVAGREYVLDVAHNPAAVDKLLEYLSVTSCNRKTICVFSAMVDKDIERIVAIAAKSFDAWYLGEQPDNKRAAQAQSIAALLGAAGATVASISENLELAFRDAQRSTGAADRLVVFGSFYTVAAVLPLLDQDQAVMRQHK